MASQRGKCLNLFEIANTKIYQAQSLMSEARELLRQDLENVRQEKSAFEEMPKMLNKIHFDSSVKLNVGGKIYETSLDTLRKDPGSMLAAMFSGRHELKRNEADGSFFIDRDGKLFRYILNYLRDGELLFPEDELVRKGLLKEAQFYQVQGMIRRMKRDITVLKSSLITDEDHLYVVLSWLPEGCLFTPLYLATTDGKTAIDFHRCCDNQGPTLMVVKSGENIFGGFASKSWQSAAPIKYITDIKSFLFSLVNPSRSDPLRITPKPGAYGGIVCALNYGPTFGIRGDFDLQVWSGDTIGGASCLGSGFSCPRNVCGGAFLTGSDSFHVDEVEVFRVEM